MYLKNPSAKIRTRLARALTFTSAVLLLAMIGAVNANGQSPKWTMTVIDDPSFLAKTTALSLNNSGHVLGRSTDPNGQNSELFIYEPGIGITFLNDVLSSDDATKWYLTGYRVTLNDAGQVAGEGRLRDPFTGIPGSDARPFRLTLPSGSSSVAIVDELDLPTGMTSSYVLDLNDFGEVVGYKSGVPALFWSPPQGLSFIPSANDSVAEEIENSGEIVGRAVVGSGSRAAYWPSHDVQAALIPYIALGAGNVARGVARDMNQNGLIVGQSSAGKSGNSTIYRAMSYNLSSGQLKNLGTLGGNASIAYSVNGMGYIVGLSNTKNSSTAKAFYYTNSTGMVELKTAITNFPTGALLETSEVRINELNQIAVTVTLSDGRTRPALLRPWLP